MMMALLLKPLIIGVGLILLYLVRIAVIKYFPEGKIKQILLMDI